MWQTGFLMPVSQASAATRRRVNWSGFRPPFNARVIDASSFSPRASASSLMRALSLDLLCCVISSPLRSYYCTCAKRFNRSTIQLYQLPQLHLKLPESYFATLDGRVGHSISSERRSDAITCWSWRISPSFCSAFSRAASRSCRTDQL